MAPQSGMMHRARLVDLGSLLLENELNLSLFSPPPLGSHEPGSRCACCADSAHHVPPPKHCHYYTQRLSLHRDHMQDLQVESDGWVSNLGPVSYSQPWDSLMHSIDTHQGALEWFHVPSQQDILGNEKANHPAEAGRVQNPLTF